MGAARDFEVGLMKSGDKRVRSLRITCRCGSTQDIRSRSYQGRPNFERRSREAAEQFGRYGWTVGRTSSGDLCPTCTRRTAAPKKPIFKLVEKPTMTVSKVVSNGAAEPPRVMAIDDALLIANKLNDVYIDSKKGYDGGWTDAKVAEELSVPRAWVSDVRLKQYGKGAADNEEIRSVLDEARSLLSEVKGFLVRCQSALDAAVSSQAEANRLTSEIAKFTVAVDRVGKNVSSIESALR